MKTQIKTLLTVLFFFGLIIGLQAQHNKTDTLIDQLSTNNYNPDNRLLHPNLKWEDIPKLLAIGNDSTIITRFPFNPVSSTFQSSCYLGIMSLWLVESVRITEQKSITNPIDKYPSLTATLKDKNHKVGKPDPNNTATMAAAYRAYINWWQAVKDMDKRDASKINPLENTNLTW